jgi:hypothetical protein
LYKTIEEAETAIHEWTKRHGYDVSRSGINRKLKRTGEI